MKQPWDIIAELESNNSRLHKESVVARENAADNDEFFRGARWALDPLITFGIRQVPEKTGDGPGITPQRFWETAARLAKRDLTGNEALRIVNYLCNQSQEREWNLWYRRILIKDLRCGVSEKTINAKSKDQYQVPVFACQLAHDGANHESKITGKKLIEVKLDGVRVITIVYPDGTVDQFSRNGKELVNFEHIKQQISRHAKFFADPMVLDGEIMSASFQDLMKQVHRKSDVAANDAVLNLFDIMSLADFNAGYCQHRQIDRSFSLRSWYEQFKDHLPNVTVLAQEMVDLDTNEGKNRFTEINASAIAGGYEGIMIKDPTAGYECKRSVAWLKQKPFIEVSLEIVALEEGTGKNAGKLGALVCEGIDDGIRIRTNVGSGLTDAQRAEIWADQSSILGQVVEIRADAKTQNQDSEDVYSLRFPRFIRFRGFKAGDKI